MPISLKAAQGGSKSIFKERPFWSSGIFVAPVSAMYLVTGIGAGGSGAWAPTGTGRAATGGAAGGLSQKKIRLNAGDTLTIAIGAGGLAPPAAGSNGNDGGDTTITGTGVALIGRGGKGGKTRVAGVGTAAGAEGGIGEGGDFNWQGGGSGSATITAAVAAAVALTGGGAVAVKGVGYKSGDASSGNNVAATGGAGVGGKSGDAISTSAKAYTAGGSSVRASKSSTNSTSGGNAYNAQGTVGSAYQSRMLEPNGAGVGSANQGASGVYWAGAGSTANESSMSSTAGLFAGSGALIGTGTSYPGVGAGSGGTVDDNPAPGGDGFAIIEWFEDIE